MSFDSPLLLLTLLAVPLAVGVYLLAERRRMRYAVRFTNLEVLAAVGAGPAWRRFVPPALFLVALATLCVAVARPHVRTLVARERATVILVIDASGSMQAQDVKPTRLAAAQEAVLKFLDRLPKKVRVGLIVFAGEPQVAAPPTTDRGLVRQSVAEVGRFPGFGGTAIGDALAAAVVLGERAIGKPVAGGGAGTIAYRIGAPSPAGPPRSPVSIVFLSDGSQTRGLLQPLEGARRAKTAGFPVYTVALGTPSGTLNRGGFGPFTTAIPVPPDPETLKAIAQTTGGQFFAARNATTLRAAYTKLGSSIGWTPGRDEVTFAFLAGAAALLVAAGVLSALWSPRLP